jgi:hypothetical protein
LLLRAAATVTYAYLACASLAIAIRALADFATAAGSFLLRVRGAATLVDSGRFAGRSRQTTTTATLANLARARFTVAIGALAISAAA